MRRSLSLLLLLPLLAGGCMTHRLWTETPLDDWNEPAANPNLCLFRDGQQTNLLVVYDEYSDRHETTRTRAYFLGPDQKPPPHNVRPHFVSAKSSRGLVPVPVLSQAPTNPPAQLYAIAQTNSAAFGVFFNGQETGSYLLPTYDDGTGQLERIAITPVSVSLDLTIIGGTLGCLWLYTSAPGLGGSR